MAGSTNEVGWEGREHTQKIHLDNYLAALLHGEALHHTAQNNSAQPAQGILKSVLDDFVTLPGGIQNAVHNA